MVADVVASNDPYGTHHLGVAPEASIQAAWEVSFNPLRAAVAYLERNHAFNSATLPAVRLFNHSWGTVLDDNAGNMVSLFFDWHVSSRDAVHVVSAGNSGDLKDDVAANQYRGVIGVPGDAHNVITVGAVDSTFANRVVYSSWRLFWDRYPSVASLDIRGKPDIVAPGGWQSGGATLHGTATLAGVEDGIENDTDPGRRLSMQGTSFAAPHVAGVSALLVEAGLRLPGIGGHALGQWPGRHHLAHKAIILNSARKRGIEPPRADREDVNDYDRWLDYWHDDAVPPAAPNWVVNFDLPSTANEWADRDYLDGRRLRKGNSGDFALAGTNATSQWTPTAWNFDGKVFTTIRPLDDELGTGMLDAERALIQHAGGGGTYSRPGVVGPIGWNVDAAHSLLPEDIYRIDSVIERGHFLTVTLTWDRVVQECEGADLSVCSANATIEATDAYRNPKGIALADLDLEIWRIDGDQPTRVAQSIGIGGAGIGENVEHLHIPVPSRGTYAIHVKNNDPQLTDYGIAWWTRPASADFVFVIDATPSMGFLLADGSATKIDRIKEGLIEFVDELAQTKIDARFAIVLFGGAPELIHDFPDDQHAAGDVELVKRKLAHINVDGEGRLPEEGNPAGRKFHANHARNPEGGLEVLRMALGGRTEAGEVLVHENIDGNGVLSYRSGARKNIVFVTDENSDHPFFVSNRLAGQAGEAPPEVIAGTDWQREVDNTAQSVIAAGAFLNMVIVPDDDPQRDFFADLVPARSQYGSPAADRRANPEVVSFDATQSLSEQESEKFGKSLVAQVLRAGLIARVFDLEELGETVNPGLLGDILGAKAGEIAHNPARTDEPVVVLKAGRGQTKSKGKVTYDLCWLSPDRDLENVRIVDSLPDQLANVTVSSRDARTRYAGNQAILEVGRLEAGRIGVARIKATVRSGVAPGGVIRNVVSLADGSGQRVVDQDSMRVVDKRQLISLAAQQSKLDGQAVSIAIGFGDLPDDAFVTVAVPPQLIVDRLSPEPTWKWEVGFTWHRSDLNDRITIDARVRLADTEDSALLAVPVIVENAEGGTAATAKQIIRVTRSESGGGPVIPGERALSVSVAAPRFARAGVSTTLTVRYREVSGAAVLRLLLPAGLRLAEATPIPAPSAIETDGTIRWDGLTGVSGTIRVRAVVDEGVAPGTVLPISVQMTDDDENAVAGWDLTLR